MVNWNPNFPEVLGNEWLVNIGHDARVWAGSPALMARLPSTADETIAALRLSATVNPLVTSSIPILVDIVAEGSEYTGLPTVVQLRPNGDTTNTGWTTGVGDTTGLFGKIDDDTSVWRGRDNTPSAVDWIQSTGVLKEYATSLDTAIFDTGGAAQNARIYWVAVSAIMGTNTGYLKAEVKLQMGGTFYAPGGSSLRDVSSFGSIQPFYFGEINPATGKPWVPADIANFKAAGTSRVWLRSWKTANTSQFPMVFALSLNVWYQTTENRLAVAMWRRPENIGTASLVNIETDDVIRLPSGTADWAKTSGGRHLYYARQSVSPSQYGATIADDVRWNMAYQLLPTNGQPAGHAFAPGGALATRRIAHDSYGRPAEPFPSTAGASSIGSAAGIALIRSDAATSVDSQPYRLTLEELERVTGAQKLGQRVTPGSSQTYIGVRFPIIPPAASSVDPTLTVEVRRVSDNVLMGGSFTITAAACRRLPQVVGGWRYVAGFLASGAALVGGTAYEIRFTSTATTYDWVMAMPDCSLANTQSFGGSTNGAFIGSTHFADRELAVTLVRQPDPPTGAVAAITNVPVTSPTACSVSQVQHVQVSWTAPASPLGGLFARYEVERQLEDETDWTRVREITNAATLSFVDHHVPRKTEASYQVRAVATDGRFSAWAATGVVTPQPTGSEIIFTSNHMPELEVVYDYDPESAYQVLSTARDEFIAIHRAEYEVAFMEAEDRGVGWTTGVLVNYGDDCPPALKGGKRMFDALLELVRSVDVPFVCALDHQGTRILGHVTPSEAVQTQPFDIYTAQVAMRPTHAADVAVVE